MRFADSSISRLPPQLGDIFVSHLRRLRAKARGDIIGDRCDLRVRIGIAESRHRYDALWRVACRAGNHDLHDIGGGAVVHPARACNGREGRNRTDAAPVVTMHTGAFEHALADHLGRSVPLLWRIRRRRCKLGWQVGRCDGRNAAQIGDQRTNIAGRYVLEALIDGLAHWASCRTAGRRVARRQIVTQLIVTPCANAGSFVGADIERVPPRRQRAGKFISVVECQREIARGVTLAAMRQRLGDIGALFHSALCEGLGRKRSSSLKNVDQMPISQR